MSGTPGMMRRWGTRAGEWRGAWQGDVAAGCCGALLVFAFAPFGVYPLAVLTLLALLWLIADASWRRAAWRGFLFGAGEFLAGVSWIYISLHDMGGVDPVAAVLMLLFLVAIMALYSAAACAITAAWAPPGWKRGLLLFPAAWTFFEWLRGWLLTGFPWLSLGYSQVDGALKGYAPYISGFGVSLCVVLSAGLLLTAFQCRGWRGRLFSLAALLALWCGGWGLGAVRWTHPAGAPLSVTLIQGDVPQDQKWEPSAFEPTLKLYRKLTDAHWASKLIVWPEAAVPAYQDEVQIDYLDPLEADARTHGTDILLGVPSYDPLQDAYYNSVISLGSSDGTYNKRHLVPFGEDFEFLPQWVKSLLRDMDLPYSSFSPGARDQRLLRAAGYAVGTSICYEDAYGSEIMRDLPQAAFLVNVSNDGWFGDSIALPQHLEIARMRALEAGRWLLRTTNTGVTAIVDDGGQVRAQAPTGRVYVLDGEIQPLAGATPVTRWGDMPVVCLSLLVLVVFGWRSRRVAA
ncbi:MAG TPA: apolipoprotein N-acyltransferase [Gammaproteobacteria bacterium]|jgi:apolipoprotein N-acyltransferase|nr:apolipoprotein N-acyltransferase [Gammaproteobacteria bacterium]